ncbi:hypothetical protein ACVCNH_22935 [Achromobacter anxifer]
MQPHYTKRIIEVIAVALDGTKYVIQRRCKVLAGDDGEYAYFYSSLADGRVVSWLGANRYRLPDGTAVHAISSRLIVAGSS